MELLKAIKIRKGEQARTILQDEVFRGAISEVRTDYINALLNTKVKESEEREKAYMAVRLLKEIEGKLQSYVSDALYEQNKP